MVLREGSCETGRTFTRAQGGQNRSRRRRAMRLGRWRRGRVGAVNGCALLAFPAGGEGTSCRISATASLARAFVEATPKPPEHTPMGRASGDERGKAAVVALRIGRSIGDRGSLIKRRRRSDAFGEGGRGAPHLAEEKSFAARDFPSAGSRVDRDCSRAKGPRQISTLAPQDDGHTSSGESGMPLEARG